MPPAHETYRPDPPAYPSAAPPAEIERALAAAAAGGGGGGGADTVVEVLARTRLYVLVARLHAAAERDLLRESWGITDHAEWRNQLAARNSPPEPDFVLRAREQLAAGLGELPSADLWRETAAGHARDAHRLLTESEGSPWRHIPWR